MDPQTNAQQGQSLSPEPQYIGTSGGSQPPAAPPMISAVPQVTAAPAGQQSAAQPVARSSAGQGMTTPDIAADNDVIEPEWIHKAKQVVADTHDDPYRQVREVNKLKTDYMKKRYDKDILLPDA